MSIFCLDKLFLILRQLDKVSVDKKNLLSEFSNGEGSVLLVAPRDQRGKTRHEEVKPLQVALMIMVMIMVMMIIMKK